ncbi:MAG: hypothetical protein A2X03_14750 [Bacteroidetes bacterium GWA2_40_15]|nr:MAG: hypothetical protein A2X03_14750 [Bacteroidetes bacterium GWA2_40_15]
MKKKRICVIDLIYNTHTNELYQILINSGLMSIMPQVIGVWCRQQGHEVHYVLYGGRSDIVKQIPDNLDLVFISSFTFTAQLAYSISNMLRSKGVVSVLGGPHARCYPEDSCKYFDYVVGLLNKELLLEIISDGIHHHSPGIYLSGKKQPHSIPSVEERWEFIEKGYSYSAVIKLIPMISSFGCPYKCDFCIDSSIPYQQLDIDALKSDFHFILSKVKRPRIGWYDPNFGVRFNTIMNAIEESIPPGRADFIAECNLSTLTESNVRRMRKNGFSCVIPGIESWYNYGKKAGMNGLEGFEKVRQVSAQLNMIQKNIPYVNVNFIMGLDNEQGQEPFELTKRFIDMTPGVYPSFLLFGAFGRASHANLKYQEENRIIPIPFHSHRSTHFTNIKPGNYTWFQFYECVIDLLNYSFSNRALYKRFRMIESGILKWFILSQSVSTGGYGKISFHASILNRLRTDKQFRSFFEQETTEIPVFFRERVKNDLGPQLWSWLPEGALEHDPNIYLKSLSL